MNACDVLVLASRKEGSPQVVKEAMACNLPIVAFPTGDVAEVVEGMRKMLAAMLGEDVHLGNFVETKKARLGKGSKANHLSYLGDAEIGAKVNVGAGTITCNYDGTAKHETKIGARAFVGTNSSLVAPLTIGADAYIGAGSVITKDVPPGALAVGRAHQVIKEGWSARRRRASRSLSALVSAMVLLLE